MWLQLASQWLVLAATVSQPGISAPAAPASPSAVVTRQRMFAVPYRLDRAGDAARRPVEVQLYVSSDRGARWGLYAKAPPTQQHFMFRAGLDGEYWFAVRTIDRDGRATPERIAAPGLRIVVDTTPPAIRLAARLRQDGSVAVRWDIDEQHLKTPSLRLFYRPSPNERWTPLALDPKIFSDPARQQSGEVAFRPRSGSNRMLIRAEASDTAGNLAAVQTPVAPATKEAAKQTARESRESGERSPATDAPSRQQGPALVDPSGGARRNDGGASSAAESSSDDGSVSIAINPPVGGRHDPTAETRPLATAKPSWPSDQRPRMVNSRRFELQYEIESVGPSGVGRVELWATRDGGKTWRRFTVDEDRRSPMSVYVEDEGVYGFRVVVANGAGLGGQPPRSGDVPDLWIDVDLTRPTARIVSAQLGAGDASGQVVIEWQAADAMLAAHPVSLFYRRARKGPWHPIASGLENTGRYAWAPDASSLASVYLRIEVRDEAGNLGEYETPEPVAVDQSRPTARIRDVRLSSGR